MVYYKKVKDKVTYRNDYFALKLAGLKKFEQIHINTELDNILIKIEYNDNIHEYSLENKDIYKVTVFEFNNIITIRVFSNKIDLISFIENDYGFDSDNGRKKHVQIIKDIEIKSSLLENVITTNIRLLKKDEILEFGKRNDEQVIFYFVKENNEILLKRPNEVSVGINSNKQAIKLVTQNTSVSLNR